MNLTRTKTNRIILQKNISSADQIEAFLNNLIKIKDNVSKNDLLNSMRTSNIYKGRSNKGSENTMGVRLSQFKFFMFGYVPRTSVFIPSPITRRLINNSIEKGEAGLVSLMSLQFPHPYSKTPKSFNIHFGRLILTLLSEAKLDYKLYYDEIIWFIPFIEIIDYNSYNDLVREILLYRQKAYAEKLALFESVENYNDVFSNVTHEFLYYFDNIYSDYFEVIDQVEPKSIKQTEIFVFTQGKGTKRTCKYGYWKLKDSLLEKTNLLLDNLPLYQEPLSMRHPQVFSKTDLLNDLYESVQIESMSYLTGSYKSYNDALISINKMIYSSKYGSKDGKEFEESLKPVFELFEDIRNVEIHSGSGMTDLLCVASLLPNQLFKFNVDAKTTSKIVSSLNPRRLNDHILKNNSDYCIVISPRFSKGAKLDIGSIPAVTIEAESLANFIINDMSDSSKPYADFAVLDSVIRENIGKDITNIISSKVESSIGIFGKID